MKSRVNLFHVHTSRMQTYKSGYNDRGSFPLNEHHVLAADGDCRASTLIATRQSQSRKTPSAGGVLLRSTGLVTSCAAWKVCLLGSRPELGDWEATKALELKTGPKLWPRPGLRVSLQRIRCQRRRWTAQLPPGMAGAEFKLVIRRLSAAHAAPCAVLLMQKEQRP